MNTPKQASTPSLMKTAAAAESGSSSSNNLPPTSPASTQPPGSPLSPTKSNINNNNSKRNSTSHLLPQPPNGGQLWLRGAQGTPPSKKIVTTKIVPKQEQANSSSESANNNNEQQQQHQLQVIISPAMEQSLAKKIVFDPRCCFIDIVTDEQAFGATAAKNLLNNNNQQSSSSGVGGYQKDSCFRLVKSPSGASSCDWPQGLTEIPLKAATRVDRTEWIKYLVDLGGMARGEASLLLAAAGSGEYSSSSLAGANGSDPNLGGGGGRNRRQARKNNDQGFDMIREYSNRNNSLRDNNNNDDDEEEEDDYFDEEEEEDDKPKTGVQQSYDQFLKGQAPPITQPLRAPPPYTLVIPQIRIDDADAIAALENNSKNNDSSSSLHMNNSDKTPPTFNLSVTSSDNSVTVTPQVNKALGVVSSALAQGANQKANVIATTTTTTNTINNTSSSSNNNTSSSTTTTKRRREDTWSKVTTASTPIYRNLRTEENAALWSKHHSTIYSYSDRDSLPPVEWSIINNNNNNNNNNHDSGEPSSSMMPSLDTVAERACLEAMHSASNILFFNNNSNSISNGAMSSVVTSPNSSASTTSALMNFSTSNTSSMNSSTATRGINNNDQEQLRYREQQLALMRRQKLGFGIPWNEDQETIKRTLERVQLSSVDIAYDLIKKSRHSCDDPRKKPVKCVAVLCDLNKISSAEQLMMMQKNKNSKTINNNNTNTNKPVFVVQAGQAGLQVTDDAVVCRGPSFDFSCRKNEIKNVEGGSGDASSNEYSAKMSSFSCASSMGGILEQISLNEFTKWMPYSEYSFLFEEFGNSSQNNNNEKVKIKELPSTIIVRVSKKQINTQLQRFLTIEEETDLHLVLMFKWPVRADTAAKALNDFWLSSKHNNKPSYSSPIPQRSTRVNQHGVSLFQIFEKELLPMLQQKTSATDNNDNGNSSENEYTKSLANLMKKRQAEREPDFESMQKWTMLDFYQTKKQHAM